VVEVEGSGRFGLVGSAIFSIFGAGTDQLGEPRMHTDSEDREEGIFTEGN
jgi:hypothetical protein